MTTPGTLEAAAAAQTEAIPAAGSGGVGQLGDAQLLCVFLGLDERRDETLAMCAHALQQAGGLRGLLHQGAAAGKVLPGFGPLQQRQVLAAAELYQRQLRQSLQRGAALSSPADTLDYLRAALRDRRREIFTCLFLDTRHRVIACEELFQGSIDGACVYPRVVAEKALRHGAAAVIIAHNHPSGVAEPSLADQAITRRLREALALLEIRLLDHFVIGDGEPVSMASRGML